MRIMQINVIFTGAIKLQIGCAQRGGGRVQTHGNNQNKTTHIIF